jgi:GNAT superfamily N-acetyltransferase
VIQGFVTEALNEKHDRKNFSCGEEVLDLYLRQYAKQDQKRRVAAVFVLPDENKLIKGYYTLSSTQIPSDILPDKILKKLPRHPFQPATLLGRLAVATPYQKQGIGEALLIDALYRSYSLSEQIGSIAVVVDALNKKAVSFYENYEFIKLSGQKRLFLPMKTIKKLF